MMRIFAKRFLLLLILGVIMCLSIFLQVQVVKADVLQSINDVSVEIASPDNQPVNTSQIQLRWLSVPPVNGGIISYDIEKSTNGFSMDGQRSELFQCYLPS